MSIYVKEDNEERIEVCKADYPEMLQALYDVQEELGIDVLNNTEYLRLLAWAPKYSYQQSWIESLSKFDYQIYENLHYLCHAHNMLRICKICECTNIKDIKKIYWEMCEADADIDEAMMYYREIILHAHVEW